MIIPRCVETTIKILDLVQRADVEYVPGPAICRHLDCNEKTVTTILSRLTAAGIFSSKRGPSGGYKQTAETNLLELFLVAAPSCVQRAKSIEESVNKAQLEVINVFSSVIFKP
jgi:DNA-binding IscR family transcriptional regulator